MLDRAAGSLGVPLRFVRADGKVSVFLTAVRRGPQGQDPLQVVPSKKDEVEGIDREDCEGNVNWIDLPARI